MKIGYFLSPGIVVSGQSNGVLGQATLWKREMEARGHSIEWIAAGNYYNWSEYDCVHLFQGGDWLRNVVPSLRPKVKKIIFSPIIDSNFSPMLYRLATMLEFKILRMRSENSISRQTALHADMVLARSQHEFKLIRFGLGAPVDRVELVKLAFKQRVADLDAQNSRLPVCLHVSSFTQKRKNVLRLIEACHMADIELWIAGRAGSRQELERIRSQAVGKRVKFLGFMSDVELCVLMSKVKVFALPSLCEGVGLSALEAAACGCEVVVTQNGGPPDYFGKFASYVDPYNLKSIKVAILRALSANNQPQFADFIRESFSPVSSVDSLEKCYSKVLASD